MSFISKEIPITYSTKSNIFAIVVLFVVFSSFPSLIISGFINLQEIFGQPHNENINYLDINNDPYAIPIQQGGAATGGAATIVQDAQTMNQLNGAQLNLQYNQCTIASNKDDICKGPNNQCVSAADMMIACNQNAFDKLINSGRDFSFKNNGNQSISISNNNNYNISNREKLVDTVSTPQELETILNKFKDFAGTYMDKSMTTNTNNSIATSNFGSANIYYSINPQYALYPGQMIKGN